jgi:hypothetical protein
MVNEEAPLLLGGADAVKLHFEAARHQTLSP